MLILGYLEKCTVSIYLFAHLVNTLKVNSHSFNTLVGISPTTDLLVLRSRMIFLTSLTETGRSENFLIPLYFVFILQMLGCFSQFLIIPLISPEVPDVEKFLPSQ